MYLEPASRETAVIPNLTQLIWLSVSIRKYYESEGGRGSCSLFLNGGLNGEDFIKLQASYGKNLSMGLLPCTHGCVHVDEDRCKLDLENCSSPSILRPTGTFI